MKAIQDIGPVGATPTSNVVVRFSPPVEVSRTAQRIEWTSTMTVADMPPLASTARVAQLVFSNNSTQTIRYMLTTRSKNFTWSVTTGTKSLVSPPNASFDAAVMTSGDGGTNLHIDSNSLHEASSRFHVDPAWLQLCTTPAGDCAAPTIPEGTRTTVIIRFLESIPNGNYSGSINLALNESADARSVEVAFSRSTCGSRWAGVGLIVAGVLLSFLGSTVARNLSAAAEAMLPAARLQTLAGTRRQRIIECDLHTKVPKTLSALDDIVKGLSPGRLRDSRFVPRWFASPFGAAQIATDAYAAYLQETSNHLAALGFLIEFGICKAAREEYDPNNRKHVEARSKVLKDLDELSLDPATTTTQLASDIPNILGIYDLALRPAALEAQAASGRQGEAISERPRVEDLEFRINMASIGAWMLALTATIVTGYAVLIASNPGFGIEMDFVKCFLWGLGVQVAGQQLSQLTPSSVTSTLGFKAPTS